ncbi:uncharacterized protein LOC134866395 [Eleginops maclovinus]|uniref:uncharacterized protein LOC134866395 n=1 Tax=Eleginops maclovinus TaxID=56733 RepID=UPI0030806B64
MSDNHDDEEASGEPQATTSSEGTTGPRCAILDGKFFKVVSQNPSGKIEAECQLCTTKKAIICGSYQATTNFKTHLKRKHPENLQEFENYKKESASGQQKKAKTSLRQTRLFDHASPTISQSKVDSLVKSFVVKGMHSLATVEQTEFIELVQGLHPGANVMSRRTLGRRIDEEFATKKAFLKETLKNVRRVCTTVDIWSTKKTSYLGATVHWINGDTLERQSAALAVRHFPSPHTYNRIAELLDEIHTEYGLSSDTIVSTVTDNASNFAKAFKEFSVTGKTNDPDEVEELDDELSFLVIDPEREEASECSIILPPHLRCATHTLSLISTTDVKKSITSNATLSRLNHSTMAKCSALWTASGRPKSAETLGKVIEQQLKTPCITRWNSLHDSLSQLSFLRDKLPDAMTALQLPPFREVELDYIEEFCRVLRPIAISIDRLQGQSACYYGELLPTLFTIQAKLEDLQASNLRYCSHVLQATIAGFKKRFHNFLMLEHDVNEAILDTTTHPYFKMRWLPQRLASEKRRIQQLMLHSADELGLLSESDGTTPSTEENDEFFVFTDQGTVNQLEAEALPSHSKAELETLHFLEDPRKDLASLNAYPLMKQLFVRFNTTLPSSAPVERLFSFAGLVNRPHRRSLTPDMLEKLVVLKNN